MKILCWNFRGIGNPVTVRELKQMVVANDPDIIFLSETKINVSKFSSVHSKCKMEGCLAVNANGKSGGLVMMWKESNKVEVQTYSSNYIDSIIKLENDNPIRFTEFYGNVEPNKRQCSWNMLRRVGKSVKEKWIIGGDFNAILDNAEKEGVRESQVLLWRTFGRDGMALVKERLDRFLMSANDVARAKDVEAKKIIKKVWQKGSKDIMGKIKMVRKKLGGWQYKKLKQMRNQMTTLQANINKVIDSQWGEVNDRLLKEFMDNEIKEAFSQMDPRKASGIDDLSGNFF
ncbi:hypothetical protein GOBAR_AA30717 [Gossypium barbadense]|uniref:Endonuclease/exonuclease/phosphatase domain-containing protein n=1 Tax=Gossypium barbadense TaxID=3634 RepID=A0A2P5WFV4_GOSBA|nr:hypothetical protein GOBAR_AA30717 [Gossypium barbadense]